MARFRCARRCSLRLPDRVGLAAMHFPCIPQNESILTEKKRQGKSSFPLALLYSIKNYFFTGVGVATELLPFPSPISCCINKKIPTPRSTSPTLAIPGNT